MERCNTHKYTQGIYVFSFNLSLILCCLEAKTILHHKGGCPVHALKFGRIVISHQAHKNIQVIRTNSHALSKGYSFICLSNLNWIRTNFIMISGYAFSCITERTNVHRKGTITRAIILAKLKRSICGFGSILCTFTNTKAKQ